MERGIASARDPLAKAGSIGAISVDDAIELRPASIADCAVLYAAIERNRPRLRKWLPWLVPGFNEDTLFAFLRDRERDNAERISLTTTIWTRGRLCGSIGLHVIDRQDRSTSIGYWLDASHEGRGIMTRACRAIVTEGFRNYGLHRIEIRCAVGNDGSSGIPRRLGFMEEGILREAEWLYDHWVDLRVFSMLEQDWK
jgi:ribosomal-protein-serine acetyltransferase